MHTIIVAHIGAAQRPWYEARLERGNPKIFGSSRNRAQAIGILLEITGNAPDFNAVSTSHESLGDHAIANPEIYGIAAIEDRTDPFLDE